MSLGMIAFALQFIFIRVYVSETLPKSLKFLLNFFLSILSVVAAITSFRACWYLADDYFIPGKLKILLTSHFKNISNDTFR